MIIPFCDNVLKTKDKVLGDISFALSVSSNVLRCFSWGISSIKVPLPILYGRSAKNKKISFNQHFLTRLF